MPHLLVWARHEMKEKQEQFLKLYEPVHERFERFCRARVFGELDFRDLMNDTLLVAFEKFDSIKSHEAFLSFLFSVSVRLLSNMRQKKREVRFPEDFTGNQLKDSGVSPQQHADVYYLYETLRKLPDAQRESIILFEISGFSIAEIAEIQSSTESAVKQRLKRGREKLTELMTFEASLKTVNHE